MPGWEPRSWGFHGDDGQLYNNDRSKDLVVAKYGTGDVVGCGVDFTSNVAFFTRNGEKLRK
jgi:Ran-binding protein 9/10